MDAFEHRAAAIKANPAAYRELERIVCECSSRPPSTIAIMYAGEDGNRWLWTPGGRGPLNHPEQSADGPLIPERIPARAVPLPREPGDVAHSTIATCPRCRSGLLLMPQVGHIQAVRLGAPTWGRVTE